MAQIMQVGRVAQGLLMGTPVMTAEGALPVEYLCPGDRIITRAGMRTLVSVTVRVVKNHSVSSMDARLFHLGFAEDAVIYAGGRQHDCPVAQTPSARSTFGS